MTGNSLSTDPDWIDPDDAPDLSAPEWQAKSAKARRGRPPVKGRAKIAINLRLDADVIECLRQAGPGWQTRANDLLRNALGLL